MATPAAIMKIDMICLEIILMVFCSLVEDSSFLLKFLLKIKKIPSTPIGVEGIKICEVWDLNPRPPKWSSS